MTVLMTLSVVLGLSTLSAVDSPPAQQTPGITLASADAERRNVSLLGGVELDSSWRPSSYAPLRLTDGIRFASSASPLPLDRGGGLDSDLRQILALVLGFVPGFGLGHLIARDKDGFILFLIIDIALYVVFGTVGWVLRWGPFWGIGGVVWLVVHIIQALDAYGEAGGARIVEIMRERAVEIAGASRHREAPAATAKVFEYSF